MNIASRLRARRLPVTVVVGLAVASAVPALAASGGHDHSSHQHATVHAHAAKAHAMNAKQAAFHDAMRKLWEDHVTWTRLAIVSFVSDLPDMAATQERLLANQTHIGNAIKPYYGRAAGNKLTALLKAHIVGAVELLTAAKAADNAAVARESDEWNANGREIADFLSSANPRNWKRGAMRKMMQAHLDRTLAEAVARLEARYTDEVREYDAVHRDILAMADMLSDGIMRQFPARFR
jgi:hypothetical protein